MHEACSSTVEDVQGPMCHFHRVCVTFFMQDCLLVLQREANETWYWTTRFYYYTVKRFVATPIIEYIYCDRLNQLETLQLFSEYGINYKIV